MITKVFTIDNETDFKNKLKELNLNFKNCWKNYVWLKRSYYYRLALFDNGEYGLFTQSQLPIVEKHQELNSSNWADYKAYADKGYQEMRSNGVEAGTKVDDSWTPLRKETFRKSSEWKDFKQNIFYWNTSHNGKILCEDCKQWIPKEFIDVHHIYPEKYDTLVRPNFMILCKDCHEKRTKKGE